MLFLGCGTFFLELLSSESHSKDMKHPVGRGALDEESTTTVQRFSVASSQCHKCTKASLCFKVRAFFRNTKASSQVEILKLHLFQE